MRSGSRFCMEDQVRIGVMERVLRQPRDRVFTAAAELGFEGVEIEVRDDCDAIASLSRSAGVPVCSVICDGDGLGSEHSEARRVARSRLLRAVANAAAPGADGILLPLFEPVSLDDAGQVSRLVEDLAECAAFAARAGVTIGWEGALDAAATRAVIHRVGSPALRCYYDLANGAKRGADPAGELAALGDLVFRVHAKNLNRQPLDAPGVDLAACLSVLKQRGYDGWIVLETAPGDDPLASAAHNLRVVRETRVRA
jgi:sugar phosphate isomerase/epimerase